MAKKIDDAIVENEVIETKPMEKADPAYCYCGEKRDIVGTSMDAKNRYIRYQCPKCGGVEVVTESL